MFPQQPDHSKLMPDQVALLQSDNVVSDAAKSCRIDARGAWDQAGFASDCPATFWRFRATGQFQKKSV